MALIAKRGANPPAEGPYLTASTLNVCPAIVVMDVIVGMDADDDADGFIGMPHEKKSIPISGDRVRGQHRIRD